MPKRDPEGLDICTLSGKKLHPPEFVPVAMWSKTGVYAVNALRRQECPGGSDCGCGGWYESWFCAQGLSDLMAEIPERPLFASQDDEGRWFQVECPEGVDPEDDPEMWRR